MNWDSMQQIVRILMAYVGSYLVSLGFPDDMVKVAVGGGVAAAGLAWWWFWDRKRADPAAGADPVA